MFEKFYFLPLSSAHFKIYNSLPEKMIEFYSTSNRESCVLFSLDT